MSNFNSINIKNILFNIKLKHPAMTDLSMHLRQTSTSTLFNGNIYYQKLTELSLESSEINTNGKKRRTDSQQTI